MELEVPANGQLLRGDYWPEVVRVLSARRVGDSISVEAVGVKSNQYYQRVVPLKDWARIEVVEQEGRDFAGRGQAFFLGVEGHRIRFAYQFDPLFAVNTSQVDPLPHQIEAVYHVMLPRPRLRFLLADDPGAGKTIMTGLLLKELKARGLVGRVLIVVPGHLRDQWLREMRERFGETFTVVDRRVVNATWGRNVWAEEPQIIASMDFAKQQDVMAAISEADWDLVVVDEAHKMAAYQYGQKVDKTDRYRLGELLSRRSRFLLFLTATPHRGDPQNFRLFLDLLVPGMFADENLLLESIESRDNPLYIRRLKEDLRDFEGRPLFPPRHVRTLRYRLSDHEKRLYNAVTEYVQNTYNRALAADKRNVAFALLILQRRLSSSVRAARRSLERRRKRLQELLEVGKWVAERGSIDEEELEDRPELERWRQEDELIERLTAAETRDELEAEIRTLDELIRLARQAERQEIETKLSRLREVMEDERIRATGEKLLIFTESRDTMEYLAEKIQGWGYSVVTLHGGLNLDDRIAAEHEFRDRAQLMVSTEAGGEGINLQFCSLMVNYDIPWNPNRLEQRMGRIHRYGQQKEVHIYNLVAVETREGMVLEAMFRKLESIQAALGSDRVFDVIGEVLLGRSLKDLIVEAIAHRRTMDEIVAEIEAVPDEEAIDRVRQALQVGLATRHLDLQRILGEERRARENRLVPEYIEAFFEEACKLLEIPARNRDGLWQVRRVPYAIRNVPLSFRHEYGQVHSQYNKIGFDKKLARREGAEFVAPGHPLLESIIEQVFRTCEADLERGATFIDPSGKRDGLLWFLEAEVRDGADQIAGKRLYCVYQPADGGSLRLVSPAILWDLKPADGHHGEPVALSEDQVVAFATTSVLGPYLEELRQRREHDAEVKRKYGIRSLEQMIGESEAKLVEYETRRAKGENIPEATIVEEQRRLEDLRQRKENLEREIRLETALAPCEPRVLGVARVIAKLPADEDMRSDPEIELVGMEVAMEYERNNGRTPLDVSAENLGYDIRSEAPDGLVRYIEVKARAKTGPIVLTRNEWMMAQRLGDEYWLYVVTNAATEPELHTIQSPASKLEPEEVTEIVRYVVRNWEEAEA